MKIQKILYPFIVGLTLVTTSCNDYLDEMPDNRAEVDTEEKVNKLLVSAYPQNSYIMTAELSSDNVDDYGSTNPYYSRIYEQLAYWQDVTETDNDGPTELWSSCYSAIAGANQALKAIVDMGDPESLQASKGEALMCRAYAHFVLVNIFSQPYNSKTSSTDLGIPYIESPETELDPKYQRGTVAEVYEKIDADIEKALPLVGDEYNVPKYHFNKKAAYAFAVRFNLYYGKWDKAVSYASEVLTSNPAAMLRDSKTMGAMTRNFQVYANYYIKETHKCNLLLLTAYSSLGAVMGNYYTGSRFAHGSTISKGETIQATSPWGIYSSSTYYVIPYVYSSTNLNKVLFPKLPYLFEYTDAVAGIGFNRTVYTAFTADETLLNRAEAYAMLKEYDKSASDLLTWEKSFVRNGASLTRAQINSFYGGLAYYTPTAPTIKKKLNPDFTVEAGEQENFIQCVLHFRRLLTLNEGLRWFDVKRYGIEVDRRLISTNGVISVASTLPAGDPRRAVQLPQDVISAGLTANPR